ncbi:MAG TPA: peptidoglycan bridge formation glycyltransferase FemA/FemB family protein [Firmicutes bacterium]|nr:peptidoglycan bridge formation glycyltransferase FemA/FemB family protein [Bacillota bacterium]
MVPSILSSVSKSDRTKITVRIASGQEREDFDGFVKGSRYGTILQSWAWGDVKSRFGWRPVRVIITRGENMVGAASLLYRRASGIGPGILYAPRGPVVDYSDREVFQAFVLASRRLAGELNAAFLKIDPEVPVEDHMTNSLFCMHGLRRREDQNVFGGIQPRVTWRVPLDGSLDDIFGRFSKNTRYRIRSAEKKGVRIREGNRDDLETFYELLYETGRRDGFHIRSFKYFEALWEFLAPPGHMKLFMAEYEGQVLAGILPSVFGRGGWGLYAATSNLHRNVGANYPLMWTGLKWAKSRGCEFFDFGGIPVKVEEGSSAYGLYQFKKGFGGSRMEFIGEYDLILSPVAYSVWNSLLKTQAQCRYAGRRVIEYARGLIRRPVA